MSELARILMERDGLTQEEAYEQVRQARLRVSQGEDPEEILHDEFGLEPDYVFSLLQEKQMNMNAMKDILSDLCRNRVSSEGAEKRVAKKEIFFLA